MGFNRQQAESCISLINQKRQANGLGPLQLDESLMKAAETRAQEASQNDLDHKRLDGRDAFTIFAECGVSTSYRGENLADGFSSAASVVDGWMGSPDHRSNILNGNFMRTGAALYSTNNTWCQLFCK